MNYNKCLDYIYSSYMSVKQDVAGKLDRDVRKPSIILDIARVLDVLPKKERVIKVTGSKGKGTVTRLISAHLLNSGLSNVGMLISPEEIEHYDRVRIDGAPMTQEEFVSVFISILPFLEKRTKELRGIEYLSPSGIFLLIALKWYKDNEVEHYVLECGRGAAFDEVGRINSFLSVVTSILFEHPSYLGPEIEDIAKDKLGISKTSKYVVLGPSAKEKSELLKLRINEVKWDSQLGENIDAPSWYLLDNKLASITASSYLKALDKEMNSEAIPFVSASFGKEAYGSIDMYYEALVSKSSFDEFFIEKLIKKYEKVLFIGSLPDDKDLEAINSYLTTKKVELKYVTLSGTRGYLNYEKTKGLLLDKVIAEVEYNDLEAFSTLIDKELKKTFPECVYFFGTHTFIRLVKKTYFNFGI